MSDAGTTREDRAASALARGRALNVALWVLQALLALQFAMSGILKLSGDPAMVQMFADIGVGQWFRYLVGALEIAGAVGVLSSRLSGLAALGLVGLMVGAAVTNVVALGTSRCFRSSCWLLAPWWFGDGGSGPVPCSGASGAKTLFEKADRQAPK